MVDVSVDEREEEREEREGREGAVRLAAGPSSECASRLRPKAIEKTFPPSMGESETKPQFSEKCAAGGRKRGVGICAVSTVYERIYVGERKGGTHRGQTTR